MELVSVVLLLPSTTFERPTSKLEGAAIATMQRMACTTGLIVMIAVQKLSIQYR
jgi:hypothetical protein